MRSKLLILVLVTGLTAVPAALAATAGAPAPSGESRLTRFKAFEKHEIRDFKRARRRQAVREQRRQFQSVPVPPQLEAIAACESGGDPSAVSSTGSYRGKYQFSYATWAAVGGSGDPATASEAEQDYRAALLYQRAGPGQWPVCGG